MPFYLQNCFDCLINQLWFSQTEWWLNLHGLCMVSNSGDYMTCMTWVLGLVIKRLWRCAGDYMIYIWPGFWVWSVRDNCGFVQGTTWSVWPGFWVWSLRELWLCVGDYMTYMTWVLVVVSKRPWWYAGDYMTWFLDVVSKKHGDVQGTAWPIWPGFWVWSVRDWWCAGDYMTWVLGVVSKRLVCRLHNLYYLGFGVVSMRHW